MKHKVEDIFVLEAFKSTLLVMDANAELPPDVRGEWELWKDHVFYDNIIIIAENIPLHPTKKNRVLETKAVLSKAMFDVEKSLLELVSLPI